MRSVASILALLILLPAGALARERFEAQVQVLPSQPQAGEPFWVLITGQWPDDCVPQLEEARIEDTALVVQAGASPEQRCNATPTSYQLRVPVPEDSGWRSGVHQVRAFFGNDSVYSLFAFGIFNIGEPAKNFRPEDGIWWPRSDSVHTTSGPGIGFSMEFQGRRMTLMANVYGPSGQPTWMIGSGQLSGQIADTGLLRFSGGQALFGDYAPPENAVDQARIQIEFHSRARATLWVTAPIDQGPGLLLQPIPVVRYVFGHASGAVALRGRWELLGADLPQLTLDPSLSTRPKSQLLVDRAAGYSLECEVEAHSSDVLPSLCRLLADDGALLAEFDDIGLRGMSGRDAHGETVSAIKVE